MSDLETQLEELIVQQNDLEKLLNFLRIAKEQLTWQPIETAPKDGTPIQAYVGGQLDASDDPKLGIVTLFWIPWPWGGAWEQFFYQGEIMWCPEYWMPLPEPPNE